MLKPQQQKVEAVQQRKSSKSAHTECTMINFAYMCILWISIFADIVYTDDRTRLIVSGTVGSTVVLPCELWSAYTKNPNIRWVNREVQVFEKKEKEEYQGEGYEGRVDIPEDDLLKSDCSLVLRNLTLTDAGEYMSHQKVRLQNGSEPIMQLTTVDLFVSDSIQVNCLHPLVLVVSLLSWLLFSKETV